MQMPNELLDFTYEGGKVKKGQDKRTMKFPPHTWREIVFYYTMLWVKVQMVDQVFQAESKTERI